MSTVIILYGPPQAPFTEKCRRGLAYKGLDYEFRVPAGPEDYVRWSPKTGLLPVMRVDGELVSDSTDILLKLDELRPDPPLLSPDPVAAEQQRNLEEWADESFLYYFQQWRRLDASRGDEDPSTSRLRRFGAWLRAGGTWERPETAILRGIDLRLDDLANLLGARSFFYSDQLSMADLAVYGMLYTMGLGAIPGAAPLITTRPTLLELMRRVEERTGGPERDDR
ncbi:MAG: glutathione S-transferase family protein [Myxococcota bacterium]